MSSIIPRPTGDHRIAVLLSGGMDSATLLVDLASAGWRVLPIRVNYAQRHGRELGASERLLDWCAGNPTIADQMEERITLDLSGIGHQLTGSSQTDASVAVPHGHYTDQVMRKTVVPNRNMILLAAAAGVALSRGVVRLAYGAHAGDHAIYPDCRPEFIEAMRGALALCHYEPLELVAPYARIDKGEILVRGLELDVPYGATWTCYEGGEVACGKCGSCCERLEAFDKAGVPDPLPYAA